MHSIYKWFVGLYHENLYNFLAGFDCDFIHNQANQFDGAIGIVTIIVILLIACLYYFVHHTRFNGFISWLVVLGVVALFSWGYGFGIVNNQKNDMPQYVIYGVENCYLPNGLTGTNGGGTKEDYEYAEDYDGYETDDEISVTGGGCNSLVPLQDAQPMVTTQTYVGFGFANMFIGMIWFFLFSFILKRFSPSCRHTPWVSLWPKH